MEYIKSIKEKWGRWDASWRFAITAFLVVRTFYALWSWVILTVQPVAVHYIEVDNKPGVAFLNLQTNKTYTYFREVKGDLLTFRSTNKATIADLQTGSLWNLDSGMAVSGFYGGTTLSPAPTPENIFPYFHTTPYSVPWLAVWQRYDANWYLSIAEYGYGKTNGDQAFPPLLPLLIYLLKPLFGSAFLAGLFISHACTLYILKLLYDIFAQWGDPVSTRQALVFMLLYPTSFFLFSVYTEPLFLVFVLLSFRYMKNRAWHWAGFWVFCAVLTRPQGLALFVPMLYLMWKDRPFLLKFQHWLGMLIAGAGFLFYLYLRSKYTYDNSTFLADATWHWKLVFPWDAYLYAIRAFLTGTYTYIDALNWLVTTLSIFLLIAGWQRIPLEYSLFTMSYLLINLTRVIETKPLNSMLRYSLTLFPIFFIMSLLGKNAWTRRVIVYTCIALNLYLSAEFFGWGWVA